MSYFAPIYDFLHSKAGAALLVTLLLIGMWNMFRNPPSNTSQKLMRWRVGLQFAAIAVILLIVLLKR
jgi:Hypoxia induced protein conserved region